MMPLSLFAILLASGWGEDHGVPCRSSDSGTLPRDPTNDEARLQAAAAKRARKAEKLRATWTGRRLLVMTRGASTQVSLEQELGRVAAMRAGKAAP